VGEEDQHARCQLIDLTPASERQAVLDAALAHLDALQANGGHLTMQLLYEHLCPDLAPALASRLTGGRYTGSLGQEVLHVLVTSAPQAGLPACQHIMDTPGHTLAPAARRGLAELDPAALVDHLETTAATPTDIADIAGQVKLSLLDDPHLAALAQLMLRCVPFASDPPVRYGVFDPDPLDDVRRTRRIVMELLADHGQEWFFQDLAARPDDSGQQVVGWYLRQARARAADLAYAGVTPVQLLHLLGRADARLVRNDSDLLDVIILQLGDLQRALTQLGRSRFLWDFTGNRGTPKDENTISDWIRDEPQVRLNAPGLVDREVEVTRALRGGIGTRIDIRAAVPTNTDPPGTACVITEAKLATNDTLMTAMHDQLAREYLIPTGRSYGIYLVYWAEPEQWHGSPADPDGLMQELEQQAADAGLHIRPYILDISHPPGPQRRQRLNPPGGLDSVAE
jgi:hypothetical protein